MSRTTGTASWTTCGARARTRSRRADTQRSAAASTETARAPTQRTALRAKSTSTSDAYSGGWGGERGRKKGEVGFLFFFLLSPHTRSTPAGGAGTAWRATGRCVPAGVAPTPPPLASSPLLFAPRTFELGEHRVDRRLRRQRHQHVQLLRFDVGGVVVLDEKGADLQGRGRGAWGEDGRARARTQPPHPLPPLCRTSCCRHSGCRAATS